ncbi:anthranilate phosphoribosyltransferase [Clostridium tyrobutyricum]|uniref:anthranilate phosphoribosyltransferase n=1 Tax=Clostridium tyrobutyricum TaxID=1519 RepID=UPI001C3841FA|nr:anthranilate phosphoribosyltransferase [Clostridium tyrobutyricum]MBV4419470.1 anthranilate phosphoribosyltransferase [Clostridium tyrobutyricum]
MLNEAIKKIVSGNDLSENEAEDVMNSIMSGKEPVSTVSGLLIALKMKGESISEITGCARAMRKMAVPVNLRSEYSIDTCGTGGDGGKTFNISTAASIIAAAAGIKVAKHGNKAVSSKSGSADVLKELGIKIDLDKSKVEKSIDDVGMGFLFAPMYHSAMKNVAGIRKELGVRTIFNILGPITNPAFVKGQILGVYKKELTHPIAKTLMNLGCERAMVVHGADGLDEITTTALTYVSELKDGEIKEYTIDPEEYGIEKASYEDISGGTPKENADIILDILKGKKGKKRDIVVLNSAAALYVGKKVANIKQGIDNVNEIIDSNKAYEKLQEMLNYSKE